MEDEQKYLYKFQVNNDPPEPSNHDQVAAVLASSCGEGLDRAEESMQELHERGTITRRTVSSDGMRITFTVQAVSSATNAGA